ncbi:hypothetical protein F5B20DRAFT_573398 [Whalleya microplaca]|nr:hypothetical protein F5B20DRAFT_573398 [Whalleya microplaca]
MDEFLFSERLKILVPVPEPMRYLEILNYSCSEESCSELHTLSPDDFGNFLTRKGATFRNGIRLVIQSDVKDPRTFYPDVISLPLDNYESMVREMCLPFRAIESSSAVGPFFWWACHMNAANPQFQFVFRKSDVQWRGTSRGFEMTLSYSFQTQITSGYVKGTASGEIEELLHQLRACGRPSAHPLLAPILVLSRELSSKNDKAQRDARDQVRRPEIALGQRYAVDSAIGYAPDTDIGIDVVSRQIADCQCKVLQKRPQAWRNVVERLTAAMNSLWGKLQEQDQISEVQEIHFGLLSQLSFLSTKLEGLENYACINSIINQRESRLSLRIAAEQHQLANASKRDNRSMKTLTFLGSLFLPGTFLSSIFSMSFFDFSNDNTSPVSARLWLYLVIMVPLTFLIVGGWWKFDQLSGKAVEEDENHDESHMKKHEAYIMQTIRRRTGARVITWD